MPAPNPDHLLDQASRLIARAGGGAPRQTDLRRAISNAYYALFHAIAIAASDDLAGSTHRNTPRYSLVYRSIDHRSLRGVCDQALKAKLSAKYSAYAPKGGFDANLRAMASVLVELQERRHLADYHPGFRAKMSDAIFAVATARNALSRQVAKPRGVHRLTSACTRPRPCCCGTRRRRPRVLTSAAFLTRPSRRAAPAQPAPPAAPPPPGRPARSAGFRGTRWPRAPAPDRRARCGSRA